MNDLKNDDFNEFFERVGTESDREFNYQGSVKNLSLLANKVARGLVRPNDMFYLKTLKYILIAKKAPDGKVGIDLDVFARVPRGRNVIAVRRSGDGSWRNWWR